MNSCVSIAKGLTRECRWLCLVALFAMWIGVGHEAIGQNRIVADTLLQSEAAEARMELLAKGIDRVLDRRDKRSLSVVDTAFMQRAKERLRLRVNFNMSGSDIVLRGNSSGMSYKTTLEADNKATVSFGASYRGLSMSVAVNPAKLAGKNKDIELNLIAYGNRVGADMVYQSAKTFKGTVDIGDAHYEIPTGLVSQDMFRINAYYVFNVRRFSYPAAFSQSWVQRKSCGSVMAGLSFSGNRLHLRADDAINSADTKLNMIHLGIGVGYGYNFVVARRWLIHLSTVPELVVFSRSRLTVDDTKEKSPYRFPNITTVGRIGVVRHFSRYFVGMTAVVNTTTTGDRDQLWLNTVKWRARMFFGIKL